MFAMFLFTHLTPTSTYGANVLPGLLVIGLGLGCIFAPAIGTATLGVEAKETGVASAMVNACQQIGGSVGLALLSTLSASAATDYAKTHIGQPGLAGAAAIHGYTSAYWWAVGIFAIGLLTAVVVLPPKAGAHACTLRAAFARGIAYAHHMDPAEAAPSPDGSAASPR
jgi:hypothetical protein